MSFSRLLLLLRAKFTGAQQIEDPEWVLCLSLADTNPQGVCMLQYDPLNACEYTTIVLVDFELVKIDFFNLFK
jgi:hypothetical protein